jgi:mono/diheme cytochrome c family protein
MDKLPSGAKALLIRRALFRGLKPPAPSVLSFPQHLQPAAPSVLSVSANCLVILAVALAGCKSQPVLSPRQAEGQHLYAVRCAHCHEENDLGLKPPPPNLHGAMVRAKLPSGAAASDAEVRRVVLAGKGKMPSFSGRFTDEQLAALLSYLRGDMNGR